MRDGDIVVLRGHEVAGILEGRELEIVDLMGKAYVAHRDGMTSLPHSSFLRFADSDSNRIIALPAHLGGEFGKAGIKWVSSFPRNVERGLDRASAVLVLNSTETGRPEAILEGSVISAKRTAASAALAARALHEAEETELGLIGCGLINREIARFVLAVRPGIRRLVIYDVDGQRAADFKQKFEYEADGIKVEVEPTIEAVMKRTRLISLATTAIKSHISNLDGLNEGSTILHISLRDLSAETILACDNVVDDPDHVCRAQTSVHLAEQMVGNRSFIRCSLADVLKGTSPARRDSSSIVVFSPFGLGILDVALGKLVLEEGIKLGKATVIDSFLPASWSASPARGSQKA
ncbi:MAG TPA: 2,3-diaminopropionate biosynthesis protein SbnB [Blastocatellia bacterium]|nr:2,3-diaminopropionate biosynthesis protein SbnB [Blastocatellia bacterium]